MNSNKALLGLFVFLFIFALIFYFMSGKINFPTFGGFSLFQNAATQNVASPSATPSNRMAIVTNESTQENQNAPDLQTATLAVQPNTGSNTHAETDTTTRILCSADAIAQNCSTTNLQPICGYERISAGEGVDILRNLTYISACHYCALYAPNNALSIGAETYYALGYESGACQ